MKRRKKKKNPQKLALSTVWGTIIRSKGKRP